jgi:cation diffusion facilitator CzcD-associated flavoprotein CzcO
MNSQQQKIVIVGAGPAGLLLAHYLLRRGYGVEIYDRRPDPRQADGARSQVRDALVAHQGLHCDQTLVPDSYKSVPANYPSNDLGDL